MDLRGVDPKQLKKLADKLDISVDALLSLSLDELASLLSQRVQQVARELRDEQLAQVAGGEGILDDIDPALLELLRQRPQF